MTKYYLVTEHQLVDLVDYGWQGPDDHEIRACNHEPDCLGCSNDAAEIARRYGLEESIC